MLYWWHSRNRKGTRYWVHPINQQRRGSDVITKLYAEERNDADAKACFIAIDVGDYMEGTTTLRFSSILVLGKQCSRMNYLCPRLSVLVMVGARSHMCSLEMKPILYSIIWCAHIHAEPWMTRKKSTTTDIHVLAEQWNVLLEWLLNSNAWLHALDCTHRKPRLLSQHAVFFTTAFGVEKGRSTLRQTLILNNQINSWTRNYISPTFWWSNGYSRDSSKLLPRRRTTSMARRIRTCRPLVSSYSTTTNVAAFETTS